MTLEAVSCLAVKRPLAISELRCFRCALRVLAEAPRRQTSPCSSRCQAAADQKAMHQGQEPRSWKSIEHADFVQALEMHERFIARKPGGRRALFSSHDFDNKDLRGRNLTDADLTGARLRR